MHVKIAWLVKKHQDTMVADDSANAGGLIATCRPSSKPLMLPPLSFPAVSAASSGIVPFADTMTPFGLSEMPTTKTEWPRHFASVVSANSTPPNHEISRSKSRSPLDNNRKSNKLCTVATKDSCPKMCSVHESDSTRQLDGSHPSLRLSRPNVATKSNSTESVTTGHQK